MKTLFRILVFSMLMCMFVVMSHAQIPQMDMLIGESVKIGDKWEGKINPAETYGEWPTLSSYPVALDRVLAITGNPKIDWTKINLRAFNRPIDLCKQINIPEGETSAIVIFLFAILEKNFYLIEYLYLDDLSVMHLFKLDSNSGVYKLTAVPQQNQL